MGVKKSTSDLFINNCDEFLYYDDLVRPDPVKRSQRSSAKTTKAHIVPVGNASERKSGAPSPDAALDLVAKTLDALRAERGEDYDIHPSLIKVTIKRQNPGFNERAHGFRAFNELLAEAEKRNLLKLVADNKQSGGYIVRSID
jgi:hypothetical protein